MQTLITIRGQETHGYKHGFGGDHIQPAAVSAPCRVG